MISRPAVRIPVRNDGPARQSKVPQDLPSPWRLEQPARRVARGALPVHAEPEHGKYETSNAGHNVLRDLEPLFLGELSDALIVRPRLPTAAKQSKRTEPKPFMHAHYQLRIASGHRCTAV